jgi:hypothetical protein
MVGAVSESQVTRLDKRLQRPIPRQHTSTPFRPCHQQASLHQDLNSKRSVGKPATAMATNLRLGCLLVAATLLLVSLAGTGEWRSSAAAAVPQEQLRLPDWH